jgi:hypothetical protein
MKYYSYMRKPGQQLHQLQVYVECYGISVSRLICTENLKLNFNCSKIWFTQPVSNIESERNLIYSWDTCNSPSIVLFKLTFFMNLYPIQWVAWALPSSVKWPEREAAYAPTPSAEVKNEWSYIPSLPIRVHGVHWNKLTSWQKI